VYANRAEKGQERERQAGAKGRVGARALPSRLSILPVVWGCPCPCHPSWPRGFCIPSHAASQLQQEGGMWPWYECLIGWR